MKNVWCVVGYWVICIGLVGNVVMYFCGLIYGNLGGVMFRFGSFWIFVIIEFFDFFEEKCFILLFGWVVSWGLLLVRFYYS